MSAQVYSIPQHQRLPPAPADSRRPPLSTVVGQHNQHKETQLEKPKDKQPASPPLPRQNSKTVPPSPPKVIRDQHGSLEFQRVGFLGEGGFARVYEVRDQRGSRLACKVVTKSSLKTKKAKTKLYAEIKIHRSLEHPNIVEFQECFEDEENVYMTLELCHSGSLMDMLRRRRRFTEPEARFFMVQLIGACHYMHTHQVIHRDLKLGNLFLDRNMNIKVGDFGLAALIENPGERKKTICGTPNYIAPEVLFDTANGHSFEVDTWSIGVILYTLAVGRPPFQTKEVKEIYKRIRDNDYEFPADRTVSGETKELIQLILTQDPQMRPTLHEIVDHAFFTEGTFPPYVPMAAYDAPPDFRHISRSASSHNYQRVRAASLLDENQTSIALPKASNQSSASNASTKSVTTSIAQQEKEFQRAVQPGSPISALLSSAKRPLMVNPGTSNSDSNLFRKLQAAQTKKASPLRNSTTAAARNGLPGKGLQNIEEDAKEEQWEQEQLARRKELAAQKARIVAQMAPVREEETVVMKAKEAPVAKERRVDRNEKDKVRAKAVDRENVPPGKQETKVKEYQEPNVPAIPQTGRRQPLQASSSHASPAPKMNAYEAAARVLTIAFDHKAAGKLFRDPREDINLSMERVFITSWVDYCNKYGMAYALTDGSLGVYFNDTTTMVLSADKRHFDYIESRDSGAVFVRKSYTVEQYPEELKNKVYLLKHFEGYIMDRLWGERDYQFEDVGRTKGMEWVQKYLRMKHVIVFKLSHDVLQFNFHDHSKLILSSHGLAVTYIDKSYKTTRWTLSAIMSRALKGPAPNADPEQTKYLQRLVDKLNYCKEVLVSIHSASTVSKDEEARSAAEPGWGLSSKASKASLR
ncbi:kinase-like domain-containing protein [Mycena floridula]|nr:kinase-like domain-containing protein [Mycena floridula]